ncbi:hypothetical protein [Leucobacter luti]|uniref:hypothetical protein n=1 Tax=Leucobacter luti TaxID=340320 RepID=UPI003D026294
MSVVVGVLYSIGFGLVVLSIFVASKVTPNAIGKMQREMKELWDWRREEKRRRVQEIRDLPPDEQAGRHSQIERDVDDEIRERARELDVPITIGAEFESDGSKLLASAIRHVARANRPTAWLGLTGGFLSTVASVWSLAL